VRLEVMKSIQFRIVSINRDSSKAARVPSQRRQFDLKFRSLAVWLDQEEELARFVPEELSVLIKTVEEIVSGDCNLNE
jgi:hypothetical protein